MPTPSILIVDDEIIIARELEARLKESGYGVAGLASSGPEAVRMAVELRPDLVLMDIVLKGEMDGIEAAGEIRRLCHVPVIFVTAYTDTRTLERARVVEPFAFIVKPFSERELAANIEMALYRHRAETRLRRLESWFGVALDEIADGLIAANQDGYVTVFNATAEAITGWTRDQAVGRRLQDVLRLVHRASGEPIPFDDVAEGPFACLAAETLLVLRTGSSLPVDCTMSAVRDGQGRVTSIVTILRDASGERHGALVSLNSDIAVAAANAASLQDMLQLCARALVRNLNAAFARVWVLDSTGQNLLLLASAGLYTHLDGAHSRVPVGKYKIGLIAQERKPHLTNDVLGDPRVSDPEWARRERMASFAGYPLMVDDRLIGVMAMFARHALSESTVHALGSVAHAIAVGVVRKRLEEQVRNSQKMEAIGQLAGGVAHDFNNLLTVISGYTEILVSTPGLDDSTMHLAREIGRAGERAASLTRQLLAFSRRQFLEPRVLDLNALISDLEKMLRRLIGEDVNFAIVLDPSLDKVKVDPGQVEQVIMNLAVNARDAMPQGGKLTVETANVELDRSYARTHPDVEPGCYVIVSVSDTGCGMTPEVIARIFEPFFTTKGTGKGTGLGLSMVYGIVTQSGGHVTVYSVPGMGTTFKVYLPRTEEPASSGASRSVSRATPGGKETILLVEDEAAVRALARHVLRTCGYTVLEAGDGVDALRIAGEHEGPIDLVLTDVVMPELAGRPLAAEMGARRPGIKMLFMSGYTDDAVIRHGVLEAETDFIQKPFTPQSLASKVREVLDREPAPKTL